jgi:hypothetical protein
MRAPLPTGSSAKNATGISSGDSNAGKANVGAGNSTLIVGVNNSTLTVGVNNSTLTVGVNNSTEPIAANKVIRQRKVLKLIGRKGGNAKALRRRAESSLVSPAILIRSLRDRLEGLRVPGALPADRGYHHHGEFHGK